MATAVALANFKLRKSGLLRKLSDRLASLKPSSKEFSRFIHSCAKLRFRDSSVLRLGLEYVQNPVFAPSALDLGNIVYAFSKLGVKHQQSWDVLSAHILSNINTQPVLNLHIFAVANGIIGLFSDKLRLQLTKNILLKVSAFSPRQIADILVGLSHSNIFDCDVISEGLRHCAMSWNYQTQTHRGISSKMNLFSFSLALEAPDILKTLPASSVSILNSGNSIISPRFQRQNLDIVVDALLFLGFEKQKISNQSSVGPYKIGVCLQHSSKKTAVEVISDSCLCPITGELLGARKMKHRHLRKLGYDRIVYLHSTDLKKPLKRLIQKLAPELQVTKVDDFKYII